MADIEVKFKRKSKLEIDSTPIEDGSVLFSTDTPEIFMDSGSERKSYGGESGGTSNYQDLTNKPQINNIELTGNKSLNDLGIQAKGNYLTSVPQATEQNLGGIKAKAKTNETVEVAIDDTSGKLYVPTYPSGGGGTSNYNDLTNKPSINGVELSGNKTTEDLKISASSDTKKVDHQTNDTTFELPSNEYHVWGEIPTLTLTLKNPTNAGIVNEYHFAFTSGATATVLSLPENIKTDIVVEPNTTYECSIVDDRMSFDEWGVDNA